MIIQDTIPALVTSIQDCVGAASWKTRLATLDFLQTVIFNNFMLFCSNNVSGSGELRSDVINMVTRCLNDVQIEVRVKAAQVRETFSSLLLY